MITAMKHTLSIILTLLLASPIIHAAGDPARGKELRHECSDCHGEHGMGDEEYPQIAGLDENYMFDQLMAFKRGERPNRAEMMLWTLEELNQQDLADLSAYYATLDTKGPAPSN